MITVGDLLAVLRLRDESASAVNNAIANYERLDKAVGASYFQLTLLGRGLREAGVLATGMFTVPIVAASTAILKFGGDFETTTTKLVSLAGVSQNELEGVRQHILDLAPAVGIGPNALAEAMYRISSTTRDTKTALEILDVAAKASAAGMGDAVDIGVALTAVINSYGKENISAAKAADILTRAVQDGGAEAKQLAPILANVVPFAAQLGVSFEEVAANFATVTKLGVPASEAITQLSSVFAALTRESGRGKEALASVGLTYKQLREEIKEKGLAAALLDLKERFKDNETGLLNVVGRVEAFRNILATTGEQAKIYVEEVKRMKEANGSLDIAFKAMTDTQQFGWKQLTASVEAISIVMFDAFAPALRDLLNTAKPFLQWLMDEAKAFHDSSEETKKATLLVAGFLAVVGPGLVILGQFAMAIGNIGRGFQVLSGLSVLSSSGPFIAFFSNPFVLAAAAVIGTITVSIYNLNKELERMGQEPSIGKPLEGLKDVNGHLLMTGKMAEETNEKLGQLSGGFSGVRISIDDATKAFNTAAPAHQTLLERVAALTAAERSKIDDDKAMGMSILQIAKDTGVAADVIGVYERQVTSSARADKAAKQEQAKETKLWAQIHREAYQLAMKNLKEWLDYNLEIAATINSGIIKNLEIQKDAERKANDEIAKGTLNQFDQQRRALQIWYQDQHNALVLNGGDWSRAEAAIQKVVTETTKNIDAAQKEFFDSQLGDWDDIWDKSRASLQLMAGIARDKYNEMINSSGQFSDKAILHQKRVMEAAEAAANGTKTAWDRAEDIFGAIDHILSNIPGKFAEIGAVAARTLGSISKALEEGDVFKAVIAGVVGGLEIIGKVFGFGETEYQKRIKAETEAADKLRASLLKAHGGFQQLMLDAQLVGVDIMEAFSQTRNPEHLQEVIDLLDKRMQHLTDTIARYKIVSGDLVDQDKAMADRAADLYDAFESLILAGYSESSIIRQMSGDLNQFIIDAVKAGTGIPPALQPIIEQLITTGQISKDAAAALLGLSQDGVPSLEEITAAADRYGLKIDQLGSKVAQLSINKQTDQILKDWDTLVVGAGADAGTVLTGMKEKLQALALDALKSGATLDEGLQPLLKNLADTGQLVDENGDKLEDLSRFNFVKPLEKMVDDLIRKLDELIQKFIDVGNTKVPPVNIPIHVDNPETPSGPHYQGLGGDYMVTKPTMFIAGDKGPERATFTPVGEEHRRKDEGATYVFAPTFNVQALDATDLDRLIEHKIAPKFIGLVEDRVRGMDVRLGNALP